MRTNEDSRVGGFLTEDSVLADRAFQSANAGGSHRPYLPAAGVGLIQNLCGARGQGIRLLVHDVIGGMLSFDGLKRSGTDVENHIGSFNSFRSKPVEHLRRKMQPGGWRRDRSALLCVDSLIPLGVGRLVGASNLRWQRDVTVFFERFVDRE